MKRCLLIIAICLVAGSIANVAVAWGFAAWHYVDHTSRAAASTPLGDADDNWIVASYRTPFAHRMHSVWGGFARQPSQISPRELSGRWAKMLGPPPDGGGDPAGARVFDSRGWPTPSMWSEVVIRDVPVRWQER